MAPQKAALPLVGASYYAAVDEELRDFTRVQRHGQEDDLREALSRVIGRVQELCTLLKASCQTKTDLETQLAIAQSNLKMSIANNEMLEDALKRNAASKDVGWRRAPMSSSQRTSVDDTARPLDVGAAGSGSGDGNGNGEHAPPTPSTSQSTAAIPPPQNPPSGSTSAAANTQDGRFFRFRFSSGRTTPGQSPTSPPGTARPSLSGPSGHLTSASLPSLVQPLEEAHAKELEEFRTRLEEESKKLAKAVNEKIALEGELETLSQALFEEANKMVASERIKRAEAEEELKEALQEKEALRAAIKLMEHERTSRSAPALPPESAATAVASIRSRSSSVGAITSPIEDRESASPPVRGGNEAQRVDSPDDGNGRGIPALYAIPDRASSFQARHQISVNMDARTPELASDASTPAADSSSASSIEPSPWNQERTHAIPSHTSFASPSPDEQDSPWR